MKATSALGALVLLLLPTHFPILDVPMPVVSAASRPEPITVLRGTIGRNATLATALRDALSPAGVYQLVEAARPIYNLARLSVGHPFGLTLGADGVIDVFTYGIDELRTLRVMRRGRDLSADVVTRNFEVSVSTVSGVISSSLFAAVGEAGEEDQLALDLAEIFAWDVDFNTELQRGDSFRLAVEKLKLDGNFVRNGRILSAEFVRGSRTLQAVRFDSELASGYYQPDGTPLRKAFLRSPLRFSRISSRFSLARMHPILHEVRPHLGVDYAAAAGTPVMAACDGVVTQAGWLGGYGQAVRIRHPNGFETLYGHLSRILVRRGQRVAQGSPIGAVGATGLATAPHLDYRMLRDGVYLDPLKVQSPPAEPIAPAERATFEAERTRLLALLGDAPAPSATAAVTAGAAVGSSAPLRR